MDRGFATVMALFGLFVGFFTGRAYQAMSRGWADYQETKAKVPPLLRLFWSLLGTAAGWIVVVAIVVVAMVAWTASGSNLPGAPARPRPAAPVVLHSPSPR